MTSYYEKLKDPRWQKKRLEVFERANFKCEECDDSESTLHAHHRDYIKGREPWDYDVYDIACLCESCHKSTHRDRDIFKQSLTNARMDVNNGNFDIRLAGFIDAMAHDGPHPLKIWDAEYLEGVCHYFKVSYKTIGDYIDDDGYISSDNMTILFKRLMQFDMTKES